MGVLQGVIILDKVRHFVITKRGARDISTHIAKRAPVEPTATMDELIKDLHDTILTTFALRPGLSAIVVRPKLASSNKRVYSL